MGHCYVHAQVTTSSIAGIISDGSGNGLPGATVSAVHLPTGTQYGVSTRAEGQFTLPNLRVGGPYRIVISYVGYQSAEIATEPDAAKRIAATQRSRYSLKRQRRAQ
jgi:hypothetical protein